jgi:hypothetical protein
LLSFPPRVARVGDISQVAGAIKLSTLTEVVRLPDGIPGGNGAAVGLPLVAALGCDLECGANGLELALQQATRLIDKADFAALQTRNAQSQLDPGCSDGSGVERTGNHRSAGRHVEQGACPQNRLNCRNRRANYTGRFRSTNWPDHDVNGFDEGVSRAIPATYRVHCLRDRGCLDVEGISGAD